MYSLLSVDLRVSSNFDEVPFFSITTAGGVGVGVGLGVVWGWVPEVPALLVEAVVVVVVFVTVRGAK